MGAKEIIGIVPTAMALRLASDNLNYKKKKKKGLVDLALGNITGASLIQATSNSSSW